MMRKKSEGLALIYLPSFAGSPHELDPLPSLVAKALNAALIYDDSQEQYKHNHILSHLSKKTMLSYTLKTLMQAQQQEQQVIIMGHSTGATLGTWLSYHYPQSIVAQLYISPNFKPYNNKAMLLLHWWGRLYFRLTKGRYNTFSDPELQPKEGQQPLWATKQDLQSVKAMLQVVKQVQQLPFNQMNVPLFIAYSPLDKVVDAPTTHQVFNRYGARHKQLLTITTSRSSTQHTITGDARDPSTTTFIANQMLQFVQAVIKEQQ